MSVERGAEKCGDHWICAQGLVVPRTTNLGELRLEFTLTLAAPLIPDKKTLNSKEGGVSTSRIGSLGPLQHARSDIPGVSVAFQALVIAGTSGPGLGSH